MAEHFAGDTARRALERAQRKAREKLDELRVEAGYDPEGEPDIEDLLRYVEVLEAEVGGGVIARHG